MTLVFLGTSAGWPLPRLGCSCEICYSNNPKDKRLRPSLLINETILLDAPIDIYHEIYPLLHSTPYTLRYILLTHTHSDHIMGLYDLSHIYNKQKKPTIIATEGVLRDVRHMLGITLSAFTTKLVKPLEQFILDDIQASYIPVEHGSKEAYGIKLKERLPTQAGKIVCYAPEFRKILPSMRRNISGIDLVIIDGSSLNKRGQAKGHETIEEGLHLGNELKAKRVLFTNIGHKTLPHEQLEQFIKEHGGENFGIAYDRMELEL